MHKWSEFIQADLWLWNWKYSRRFTTDVFIPKMYSYQLFSCVFVISAPTNDIICGSVWRHWSVKKIPREWVTFPYSHIELYFLCHISFLGMNKGASSEIGALGIAHCLFTHASGSLCSFHNNLVLQLGIKKCKQDDCLKGSLVSRTG